MHMGFDKVEGFTAERIPVIHGLPWPVNSDGKFLIPYKFVSEFTDAEKANIQAAMNEWAVRTGKVEFAHTSSGDPGHGDTRFLKIYRIPLGDAPASASIGYRPYPAMLLSDKYINSDDEIEEVDWTSEFRFGGLLHELGHVIGISHEHQRSDSDNYLDFLEGRDNNNHNCTKYGDKTDAFAVGI